MGLCYIVLNTLQNEKSFYFVISGFAIGALVASSLLLFGYETYQTGSAARMGRATLSEESNPVILARSIAMGFLASLPIFFEQKKKMLKIVIVGVLVLFFLAIAVKTQSRGALASALGIPVLCLIICSKSKNRLKYLFLAFLLGGISLYTVNFVLESNLINKMAKERFEKQTLEKSGRLELWKQGFKAFLKRPIQGYGLNNSPLALERTLKGWSIHNNVVSIAVDLGLVGMLLFIAIFMILYKDLIRISDIKIKFTGLSMLLFAMLSGTTSVNYAKKDFWYALSVAMAVATICKIQNMQGRLEDKNAASQNT